MTDKGPLRAIDVVFHVNDDNQHPEEGIESCDCGLWEFAVADDDGELDIELDVEEAVQQDSFVGGASAVAAAAAVGLRLGSAARRHGAARRVAGSKSGGRSVTIFIRSAASTQTR